MQQGTNEWKEWKLLGIGASEIASVIGINPHQTSYEVWLVKTGRSKGFEGNSATQRGHELESRARARYELFHLEDMPPATIVHPKFDIVRVSLDGRSLDGKKVLEIKCPGEKNHQIAVGGKVPEHYVPQVQYQMAATGADECDFFSYFESKAGPTHALVNVKANTEYQGYLVNKALEFWENFVVKNIPPPLTDKDVFLVEDNPELEFLCGQLLMAKDQMEKKDLDNYKAMLVELSGHTKFKCKDVQISEVLRNGKFSYHKLTISGGK